MSASIGYTRVQFVCCDMQQLDLCIYAYDKLPCMLQRRRLWNKSFKVQVEVEKSCTLYEWEKIFLMSSMECIEPSRSTLKFHTWKVEKYLIQQKRKLNFSIDSKGDSH